MLIPFSSYRSKVLIVLLLCAQPVFAAVENSDTKIDKLEKRVAELENMVKLLLKHNEQQTITTVDNEISDTITSNKKTTADSTELSSYKENIASNTKAIERIDELSQQAEMAVYSYDDLSEEINTSMKIAGYADVEYKGSSEPGINEEFRMHHLSLFFTKQFENNIKFFSEIEYEDAPKFEGVNDGSGDLKEASGKIFVEAVNFDWNYSQHVNLRVGRFFTPAGIWSEDHYPPFVTTQERPLHIRKIFPQLVDGLSFSGNTEFTSNHFFNYTAFVGNGQSNVSGKKDLNSNKATGFKGDYKAPWLDDFTLGFTLYNDNKDSSASDADRFAYGYHVKLRQQNLTFQAEYATTDLEFTNPSNNYTSKGYYAQFLYSFDQWGLGYRYDTFDKTNLNIEEIERNSFFINYHLNEYLTLKGEYHYDQHNDPLIDEFGYYIFSVTGYLGN